VTLGQAFFTGLSSWRFSLKMAILGVSDRIFGKIEKVLRDPQKWLAQKTLEHRPAKNTRRAPAPMRWVVMTGLTA
jgi:hypothetical protein